MIKVYLISSEIGDEKLYKIGYTRRSIEQRIKEFKTGNASDFQIIESFNSKWASKIERYLHKYFSHKNVGGEWFSLNEKDISEFLEVCSKIDSNLNLISEGSFYQTKGRF